MIKNYYKNRRHKLKLQKKEEVKFSQTSSGFEFFFYIKYLKILGKKKTKIP